MKQSFENGSSNKKMGHGYIADRIELKNEIQ